MVDIKTDYLLTEEMLLSAYRDFWTLSKKPTIGYTMTTLLVFLTSILLYLQLTEPDLLHWLSAILFCVGILMLTRYSSRSAKWLQQYRYENGEPGLVHLEVDDTGFYIKTDRFSMGADWSVYAGHSHSPRFLYLYQTFGKVLFIPWEAITDTEQRNLFWQMVQQKTEPVDLRKVPTESLQEH